MRKFISTLVLVVALVGTVSAQSLDDLSKKVLDLSFGVINKGINAYEEQLEEQELEEAKKIEEETKKIEEEALEAKKAEAKKTLEEIKKAVKSKKTEENEYEYEYLDRIDIMYRGVFIDPIVKGTCTLCFCCYPFLEPVWVHTFVESDNNLWVNIFYCDNGEVGKIGYAGKVQSYELKKYVEDTGEVVPSIEMKLDNGNLTFIQDATDPYELDILIW